MEFHSDVPASVVARAVREGTEFSKNHTPVTEVAAVEAIKHDEISVLTAGNPMGRVFRVLSATTIYDQPTTTSCIVARVPAGGLLVVFDDPGKFRQVLTHDQTFGYMPASVKIEKVDMLPSEIHDATARAAAGAPGPIAPPANSYGPADIEPEVQTVTVRFLEPIGGRGFDYNRPAPKSAGHLGSRRNRPKALSSKQLAIATVFGLAVFAGVFLFMFQLGGK
jgi:hypothetical protein